MISAIQPDSRPTWCGGGAGEDSENGGVRVIEGRSIDRAEFGEVVLVGHVVPMPGHDIKG